MISMLAWGWGGNPALGRDLVVIPDPKRAPVQAGRIVIAGEREMVAGVEPAVIGVAEAGKGADFDHGGSP